MQTPQQLHQRYGYVRKVSEQEAGLYEIGHSSNNFAYDNESPRHPHYLANFRLANRLVTNGEYLAFIEDKGYQRSELWLADGWQKNEQQPLYWQQDGQCYLEI